MTAYCVGFCSDQGGFRWECEKWENFLLFENSWNTANWRSPTPFAIRLAWLYIGLVVPGLVAQIVIQQRTAINPVMLPKLSFLILNIQATDRATESRHNYGTLLGHHFVQQSSRFIESETWLFYDFQTVQTSSRAMKL